MSKNLTFSWIVIASFLAISSNFSHAAQPFQDSTKAVEYFENEINFKTNAHGVKSVVEGKRANVTIIDVRAAKDFEAGHIPGAINIPFDKYKTFEGTETDFPGLRRDGYNYIYCYTEGCNLAQKAAKKFASLGYAVKEVVGGFQAWKDEGNDIETK